MIKKPRKPITQRICESLDLPEGTLGGTSFFEAAGNREITVRGCVGLRTYTDCKVVLELCDGIFSVLGRELELKSFNGGSVSIRGIILSVHYGEECDVR